MNQIAGTYFLAKTLGAEGLKLQMLAVSFVSWFPLMLFGLYSSLPRALLDAADSETTRSLYKGAAFLIATCSALIAAGLGLMTVNLTFSGQMSQAPVVAAIVCNAAFISITLSEQIMLVEKKTFMFNILNGAGTLLSLIITIVLSYTYGSANWFMFAYYVSILFPAISASIFVFPRIKFYTLRSLIHLWKAIKLLLNSGTYSLGFGVSNYCKTQALLLVPAVLNEPHELGSAGLGLRFCNLIISALSILYPIIFIQIGGALQHRDWAAYKLWVRFGVSVAGLCALVVGCICVLFGQTIFEIWTGGVITLDRKGEVALAIYASTFSIQYLLLAIASPDAVLSERLRWLFWIETPVFLVACVIGGILRGTIGMFSGGSAVMAVSIFVELAFLRTAYCKR